MKKTILIFTLFILFVLTNGYAQTGLWTDEGNYDISWYDETDTEFTLTTPAQLAGLAKLVNDGNGFYGKTVKLGKDINLGAHYWWPIGDKSVSGFRGTFDGLKHSIVQLNMTGNYYKNEKNIALFGCFNGNLHNLNMDNTCIISPDNIEVDAYISGLIGTLEYYDLYEIGKIISNCTSRAVLKSPSESCIIGGIIATNGGSQARIENCINFSNITHGSHCGGIIAIAGATTNLYNCQNYANISTSLYYAGGIVSQAYGDITFEDCTNYGKITANNDEHGYLSSAGGIAGVTTGLNGLCQFTSCINKGDIISTGKAGGIVGEKGAILKFYKCVNEGNITAERSAGGITVGDYGEYTFIDHCTNRGNVKASCSDYNILSGNDAKVYAAGICAWYANCINCSNYGEVTALAQSVGPSSSHVYIICNGICDLGNAYNCFNRGTLSANCHLEATTDGYVSTGMLSLSGIIDIGNANNSYNSGDLIHNYYVKNAKYSRKYISGISANYSNVPITINNCYYSNEGIDYTLNGGTVGFTQLSEMQTQEFVDKLNLGKTDLKSYKADSWILDYDDGRFPNFVSTITSIPSVKNDDTKKNHSLFVQSVVSTHAELNMEINDKTDIYIYNSDGKLINKLIIDTNLIDVSHYENGNYIIIIKGKNVNRYGKLIVRH